MLTKFFLFVFSICSLEVQADETSLINAEKLTLSTVTDRLAKEAFEFSLFFDTLSRNTRTRRSTNSKRAHVRELSLGVKYKIQDELYLFVEGSAEEFNEESELFISQAYIDLDFSKDYFSSRIGQYYYPVGWLNENDHYFLNRPYYYQVLFKGQKGLDLGLSARLHPTQSKNLFFEGACFEGKVFRAADQRSGEANQRPCAFSFKLERKELQLYLTHFEYDLAFYDAIQANGIGLNWLSPLFYKEFFKFGVWSEYWQIKSKQQNGPEQLTLGGFIYPHLNFHRFRLGYRWAPTTSEVSYESLGKVESKVRDQLFRVEYQILSPLKLIYEDLQAKQSGGVTLHDEWALRVLLEL